MITVLPNTNIYQYQNKNDNEPKIETLSQSTNYYLNKVKLKTANHDYSYFIDIYNENSKIKGLTQSFFIFTELIQYFEIEKNGLLGTFFENLKNETLEPKQEKTDVIMNQIGELYKHFIKEII